MKPITPEAWPVVEILRRDVRALYANLARELREHLEKEAA